MGLFSRGPQKVIDDGTRVRGRIVAIEVSERNDNDSTRRVDEYVVELDASEGGRRLAVRQELVPDTYVRLGMQVSAWVRSDDLFIDWTSTMAEQGIAASNYLDRWKGERDATRTGITDSKIGVAEAAKKGEPGSMTIDVIRWDSKLGGLFTTLTIGGTVRLGTDEPYHVEIGRQSIPHYASHLPVVGRTVPVIVSQKRLDKVTIDWASAVMAEPGVGMPPATTTAPSDSAPTTLMSSASDVPWTPPPPPAGFTPPAPIEGVSWDLYCTIEKAIIASGGYGRKTAALIESHGVSQKAYTTASTAFGKLLMRDQALQVAFTSAMR